MTNIFHFLGKLGLFLHHISFKLPAEVFIYKSFDFIFANINLNILLNDMSAYANVMHSGSKIIFSGFYTSEVSIIDKKAESLGLYSLYESERNKWAALLYQMR